MSMPPRQLPSRTDAKPTVAAPVSAYVYAALTFLTVFSLIAGTLCLFPIKVLTYLALNRFLFLAFGVLAGLVLGAIAGIQTWLGCVRAQSGRIEFDKKRKQLQKEYGTGPSDN